MICRMHGQRNTVSVSLLFVSSHAKVEKDDFRSPLHCYQRLKWIFLLSAISRFKSHGTMYNPDNRTTQKPVNYTPGNPARNTMDPCFASILTTQKCHFLSVYVSKAMRNILKLSGNRKQQ